MNISFIKWMVGYAEGYLLIDDKIYYEGCYFNNPLELWDKKLHRYNLLQRTIEGINEKHLHDDSYPVITIDSTDIEIRYYLTGWNDYVKCLDNFDSIDQAKTEALKYIWEQEKK